MVRRKPCAVERQLLRMAFDGVWRVRDPANTEVQLAHVEALVCHALVFADNVSHVARAEDQHHRFAAVSTEHFHEGRRHRVVSRHPIGVEAADLDVVAVTTVGLFQRLQQERWHRREPGIRHFSISSMTRSTTSACDSDTTGLVPLRSPGCGVALPLFDIRAPTTTEG
jgi:hypothetical protein